MDTTCSTSESSSYCYLQRWNGTLSMSQWGCANSPFTVTVESTIVGNQVVGTSSSGGTGTGSIQTTLPSGSSPTGGSTNTSPGTSHSSSLTTGEIIGIAAGSLTAVILILVAIKRLVFPNSDAPKPPSTSSPGGFPLQPPNYGPPPQPQHGGVQVMLNNYYSHSTSATLNNPSQPSREYIGNTPHALSHENMDRLASAYSARGPRTVGSVSNDGYSDVGDLGEFSRSPHSHYSSPRPPPSEVSAAPQYFPRV